MNRMESGRGVEEVHKNWKQLATISVLKVDREHHEKCVGPNEPRETPVSLPAKP